MNNENYTAENLGNTIEIFDIPQTGYSAEMREVADTTGVFDRTLGGTQNPVPGREGETYVGWGTDNQLPYDIIRLIGGDEVTAQNKLFNVLTCYGAGMRLKGEEGVLLSEAREWAKRQNLSRYLLETATDLKYFYFTVVVLILSKDGQRINKIRQKDACYIRLAPAVAGHIPYAYYADWRNGRAAIDGVERITLLDEYDPLGDLEEHMLRNRRERKFGILLRFPTAGKSYYPTPYWASIFRGGSYDEKRLISTGKRAKLRNSTSVKYQIEIERSYWQRICTEERISDPVKRQERVKKEKENIRNFVCGIENAGKAWISGYYTDPNGHEVRDIRIINIETQKQGGDWQEDVQAAANTICYADNVHPNLVGAVPGKSQSNNSGSDKRELFVMKQALEASFHDLILAPVQLAIDFNGWTGVEATVPMIELTTLDEHRDTQEVTMN